MKKLFWIFITAGFLFTACEKEEATVTPSLNGYQKDACVITTKMIAGGGKYDEKCTGEEVGNVTVEEDAAGNVTVTYSITEPGWMIDVTHLYVGVEDGIPSNNKGNPKIGHFPYSKDHNPAVSSYTVTIPAEDVPDNYVIAAHAGVSKSAEDCACESLPETGNITLSHPGTSSYMDAHLTNAGSYDGTYPVWCIDVGHPINSNDGTEYVVDAYCVNGDDISFLSEGSNPHIDKPENLPIINWIINQNYIGTPSSCGGNFTFGDVQRAIWEVIDNTPVTNGLGGWSQCRVDEIIAAAEAAGSEASEFDPATENMMAVILVPSDDAQVLLYMTPIDCEGASETAWGYGYCEECESVGDCHDGETGVAQGISFTESPFYGGNQWGWYFYGCDFSN
jgi:hypothetical protein